jgi:hypothetical protein
VTLKARFTRDEVMLLSEEYITKYTQLYKKHFGVELPRDEAYDQAAKLLNLVKVVYRPMTEEDYQATKSRPVHKPST